MKQTGVLLALTLALATGVAAAQDHTIVPDKFVYCTTCHGVELNGNRSVDAPRLNGMEPWYVRNQLKAFKRGWRGTHPADVIGMEMMPQAALLSDEDLEDAVAFVAAVQPRPAAAPSVSGDSERGQTLYGSCAACHGVNGEGNKGLNAPGLTGQSDWYLARQLTKFADGIRGAHPEDVYGAQMRASATLLNGETDINDVVAYINTLPGALASGNPSSNEKPEESPMNKLAATGMLLGAAAMSSAAVADVKRYPLPGSDFPIAQAVEVTPDTTIVYHSGMTPRPANPDAERYSPEFWGDTEAQTLSVFARLEESLKAKGLDFGNVIKMQVYLVAPEPGGAMDFDGMMRAYRKYFGTEAQPNLPARSAFQVAGLAAPGMLVEIEVVLARD